MQKQVLRIGVGGPVGSGKTALLRALCMNMRNDYEIAAVTNDIYTKEDAQFLINNKALATSGILLAVGFIDFGIAEVIWDINNAGVFFTVMMALIAGKLSHTVKN